jgi:hypothetical protein
VEDTTLLSVKREADRAIAPVGIVMLAVAALTVAITFLGVVWAWSSTIPDWAYDTIAWLATPLIGLALALVYLAGRLRIRRRVVRSHERDTGYGVLAEAIQRGALLRYNVAMGVLAVVLFVASQFAQGYLNSLLEVEEDEWEEDARPSQTEARWHPPFTMSCPPARSSAPAPA